jgi:hypothetical protein
MAIAIGFGVLFATFITLIMVPCLYLILEDILQALRRPLKWFGVSQDTQPDAIMRTEEST